MYPNKTLTLGEFRKATEKFPDEMPILYAWTWHSPQDVCLGGYMGSETKSILLDGNVSAWGKQFHNEVLWSDKDGKD